MAKARQPSTPPWDLDTLRPEVAIVVAIKEEFEVLRAMVGGWYSRPSDARHGFDYFWFDAASKRRCVATFAGDMGPEVAMSVTAQLLALQPSLVVNVGIAGGLHDDVCIGDVVVPKLVQAYDQGGKMTDEAGQPRWGRRGQAYTPTERLVTLAEHASMHLVDAFSAWQKRGRKSFAEIRKKNPDAMVIAADAKDVWRDRPTVHAKTLQLASGHFVVASKLFAGWLREGNEEIKAVEMEAAGMLKEVSKWPSAPLTLVVRGISDHVDFPKDKSEAIEKGALRRLAMENAWRFFLLLLEHGGLLPAERGPGEAKASKKAGAKKAGKKAAAAAPAKKAGKKAAVAAPAPTAESPAGDSQALQIWREKLDLFLVDEATVVDSAAKFKLRKDIEEARAKIAEYEKRAAAQSSTGNAYESRGRPTVAVEARPDVERARETLRRLLESSKRAQARLAETEPAWQNADAIFEEPDVCIIAKHFARAMRDEVNGDRPDRKTAEVLRDAFERVLPVAMRAHAKLDPGSDGIREAETGALHVSTAETRMAALEDRAMARAKVGSSIDFRYHVDLERVPKTEISPREHIVPVAEELLKRLDKVNPKQLETLFQNFIDVGVIERMPAGGIDAQLAFIKVSLAELAESEHAIFYSVVSSTCSRPLLELLVSEMPMLWLLQPKYGAAHQIDNELSASIRSFYTHFDKIPP